jgi:hypothetical protein
MTNNDELHESLIAQLYIKKSLVERYRSKSNNLPKIMEEIVLANGRGMYCTANVWRGIRRGPLRNCFQNATHLALCNPERFIYVEGYAVRPSLSLVLGEHAWLLDRQNNHSVIDPTWRDTKDGAYLGIPFSTEYLTTQLMEHKVYGLLDTPWSRWPLRTLPPEAYLHKDVIIPDFEVPEDLEAWYEKRSISEGVL